ncbi:MAG: FAD-dependent oxidoreductase, partial [Mailhella sp.]|nr:FAD-dependent oxidoreductase [Mailhella sp.]
AGGAGIITVEASYASKDGDAFSRGLSIARDEDIPQLSMLADAIHSGGAKASIQIMHGGRAANSDRAGHIGLVSYVPGHTPYQNSAVFTSEEIARLVRSFADAAVRAREAGFDAVELHGAHGYLLAQFMSPLLNRRTDEYGGSLENRMRFPLVVLRAVKRAVGSDLALIYRMSAAEGLDGGITVGDSCVLAAALSDNGIDAIHVSVGTRETKHIVAPPPCVPCGWNASIARAIKNAVNARIPVIVAGRVINENCACDILERGDADMVAMGRALIAEPDLPNLVRDGKEDEILRCIGCNEGCSNGSATGVGIGCALNPLAGAERKYDLAPAEKKKKVLIIGGGPAGMSAALTACRKGHQVTLMEAAPRLGGLLHIAKRPPYKEGIGSFIEWMERRLRKYEEQGRLEIRRSTRATAEKAAEIMPDAVLLATGSIPVVPGFAKDISIACTADKVLSGEKMVSGNVAVLGGGLIGCETADFLIRKGCRVSIIEMQPQLAKDMEARTRTFMMERLKKAKADIWTDTTFKGIEENGSVRISHALRGDLRLPPVDAIVLAVGYRSESTLLPDLLNTGLNVVRIGDCAQVGKIQTAVRAGLEAVLTL